jgi:hypothetical protein
MKMNASLSFVPDCYVISMSEKLVEYFLNTDCDEDLVNFLFWFIDNYIKKNCYKGVTKNGEVYFMWSVHFNILIGCPKTTNSIEGWQSP